MKKTFTCLIWEIFLWDSTIAFLLLPSACKNWLYLCYRMFLGSWIIFSNLICLQTFLLRRRDVIDFVWMKDSYVRGCLKRFLSVRLSDEVVVDFFPIFQQLKFEIVGFCLKKTYYLAALLNEKVLHLFLLILMRNSSLLLIFILKC